MTWRFAVAMLALAGCAGADATTLAPHAPPPAEATAQAEFGLRPGETMAFEVRVGGVLAGVAQLAVGTVGQVDGRRAVVVKSRAETAGAFALVKSVVDEATTLIDVDSGRPLALDTHVEEHGEVTEAHAKFAPRSATVTVNRADDPPRAFRVDFGDQAVHDTHSAMAQLRGWRGAPGATKTVLVVSGRRLWRVELRYEGHDTIGSALGNRHAVRLSGAAYRASASFTVSAQKPTRTFTVWMSDDADRVPLKMSASTELGEVAMELTEYNRP